MEVLLVEELASTDEVALDGQELRSAISTSKPAFEVPLCLGDDRSEILQPMHRLDGIMSSG